jgi:hypothetical protein
MLKSKRRSAGTIGTRKLDESVKQNYTVKSLKSSISGEEL